MRISTITLRHRMLAAVLATVLPTVLPTVLAMATAVPAFAEQFEYAAYLEGVEVGKARVDITHDAARYRVQGKAWATGAVKRLTRWRSDFDVSGAIDDGRAVPERYRLREKSRSKTRLTEIIDGTLRTFKNGEPRDTEPAPKGLDLLTALFVPYDCSTLDALHTGRSSYELELIEHNAAADRCSFRVIDDDGDRYTIVIHLEQVAGIRLPARIDVDGFLDGSLRLIDHPAPPDLPAAQI